MLSVQSCREVMKAEEVTCGGKHHFMNLKDVRDEEK